MPVAAKLSFEAFGSNEMRYRDVTPNPSNRFRLPASHPVLATPTIDVANWGHLQLTMPTMRTPASSATTLHGADNRVHCLFGKGHSDRLEDAWD